MTFQPLDWIILVVYFLITLGLGLAVSWQQSRRGGADESEYFASGRTMPWWLLGTSMVATTFSTDTPNLVTDITRTGGVAGNWVWWAFALTGMLTVFVYARLWRRSGVMTDLELYELRYSGRPAAFLRGFRALYLGVFFNVVIMAVVTLAAIKIGGVMFGWSPVQTIAIAAAITVVVTVAGGLTSVLLTDFLLFGVAMTGAVAAAVCARDAFLAIAESRSAAYAERHLARARLVAGDRDGARAYADRAWAGVTEGTSGFAVAVVACVQAELSGADTGVWVARARAAHPGAVGGPSELGWALARLASP